jgi:hypothetical protein
VNGGGVKVVLTGLALADPPPELALLLLLLLLPQPAARIAIPTAHAAVDASGLRLGRFRLRKLLI